VSGRFIDSNHVNHGYIRAADGSFTTFTVQGSTYGMFDICIDQKYWISGDYADANNVNHGFIRNRDGMITTFDPPGSIGTSVGNANANRQVAGEYEDSSGMSHGFLLTP